MKKRLLPIILLIGGIVILGISGVVFILQSNNASTPEEPPPPPVESNEEDAGIITVIQQNPDSTPEPIIEVLVSLQTVQRGWQMTENEITTDLRFASDVAPNVITDPNDIIGLYARNDIYQGETLTYDDFVGDPRLVGQEDFGPSSEIPSGWIAAAVPMDRLNSIAYGMADGDTVDIMLSFVFAELDEQFQTLLHNSAAFILDTVSEDSGGEPTESIFIIDPYGRFETLPTGDLAHIQPSEDPRPFHVSMVLQNARVIQIGKWQPEEEVVPPTPTPDPNDPTPTPGPVVNQTVREAPDVVLLALPPQQQLFLKYAVESNADIDFALRNPNDGQIHDVQNVDLTYFLEQFNIEVPPNFNYTVEQEQENAGNSEESTNDSPPPPPDS